MAGVLGGDRKGAKVKGEGWAALCCSIGVWRMMETWHGGAGLGCAVLQWVFA